MSQTKKKIYFHTMKNGFWKRKVYLIKIDNGWNAYIDEIVYEKYLTNSRLMATTSKKAPHLHKILGYADSAEPDRIEEFRKIGYNGKTFIVVPADKAVTKGIDTVKSCKLHITQRSLNVLKEIQGYVYRTVNNITLDEPVKLNDHAMDAIRYGVYNAIKVSNSCMSAKCIEY